MSEAHYTGQKVPHLKFVKVRFQMAAVTLRMKPRSNTWYVLKGIVKGDNLIYEWQAYLYNLLKYNHFHSPLVYIGEVNFGLQVKGQRS